MPSGQHRLPLAENWQPDHASQSCRVCGNAFSIITRKHHCRFCGSLICGGCSRKGVVTPTTGGKPQRACTRCALTARENSASPKGGRSAPSSGPTPTSGRREEDTPQNSSFDRANSLEGGVLTPESLGDEASPEPHSREGDHYEPTPTGSSTPSGRGGESPLQPARRLSSSMVRSPKGRRRVQLVMDLKILIVGASGVGKSAVRRRICEGKYVPNAPPTYGVDWGNFSWDTVHSSAGPLTVKISLLDLAGQHGGGGLSSARGAAGVFAVTDYPVTPESLAECGKWLATAQRAVGEDCLYGILINKCDLCGTAHGVHRMSDYESALREFKASTEYGFNPANVIGHVPVSAREGTNLPGEIQKFLRHVVERQPESMISEVREDTDTPKYSTTNVAKRKEKKCGVQ